MSLLCGKCKKRFIDICGIWNEKGKLFTKAICHCGMFIYKGELSSLIDKNKTQSTQRYTITLFNLIQRTTMNILRRLLRTILTNG